MKIVITIEEAINKGVWGKIADIFKYDHYIIPKGMDGQTKILLSEYEAKQVGLI